MLLCWCYTVLPLYSRARLFWTAWNRMFKNIVWHRVWLLRLLVLWTSQGTWWLLILCCYPLTCFRLWGRDLELLVVWYSLFYDEHHLVLYCVAVHSIYPDVSGYKSCVTALGEDIATFIETVHPFSGSVDQIHCGLRSWNEVLVVASVFLALTGDLDEINAVLVAFDPG